MDFFNGWAQRVVKWFVQFSVVLGVLLLGLGGSWYLNQNAPVSIRRAAVLAVPVVKIQNAVPQSVRIPVYARGEANPGHEIILVAETAGTISSVSENLVNGGFFQKGEVLLTVGSDRYTLDLLKAQAQMKSVRQQYERVKQDVAEEEDIEGLASPQKYRQQRVDNALSQLKAAEADITLMQMQLDKTQVRAPFTGRIRQALVGVGQVIGPGAQLARVYSIDSMEVRLPLSDRQLALTHVPMQAELTEDLPLTTFKMTYGDDIYYWQGAVVRTEGGLDLRNRLLYVVARVDQPYAMDPNQPTRPMLSAGQFLEAEIQGRWYENVVILPRHVLQKADELWLVEDGRLVKRKVSILYKGKDLIYVNEGLDYGDQVVVLPPDIAIEGMKVKINQENTAARSLLPNENYLGAATRSSSMAPQALR